MEEKIAKKKKSLKDVGNADLNNHAFASFTSPGSQSLNQKLDHNRKSDIASSASKKEDDFFADFDTYNKMNSISEEHKFQGAEVHQGNLFFGFNFNDDDKSNIMIIFF